MTTTDERGRAAAGAHTPGPWRVERHQGDEYKRGTDQIWTVVGPDGGGIAELFWHFNHVTPQAEDDANARLIAAAPDLLAALLLVREWIDGVGGPLPVAPLDAAIAKATGEARRG